MSTRGRRRRPRHYRRRERGPWLRRIAQAVVAALLLALGVAIGQALGDNPPPEGTQTLIRTLQVPSTLGPAPETVTITVQAR